MILHPDIEINEPNEFVNRYDLRTVTGRNRNQDISIIERKTNQIYRKDFQISILYCAGASNDILGWFSDNAGNYAYVTLDDRLWHAYIIGPETQETQPGRYEYTYDMQLELVLTYVLGTEDKSKYIVPENKQNYILVETVK